MKLVLQCAMCGTHHPVGTPVCSTCRATGIAQLRLMFECQTCGRFDLNPTCQTCPRPAQVAEPIYELDDLIVAEEVTDDPFTLELDAMDPVGELLELDSDDEEDEIFVVTLSEDDSAFEDSDFEDSDDAFDLEIEEEFEEDNDTGEEEEEVDY